MDGPGHYFRRIKIGRGEHPVRDRPVRQRQLHADAAQEHHPHAAAARATAATRATDADDDRFSDHFGSMQSIVTSSGQNDSGLFETNLRDERYLPFENSGAISEWQLELPDRACRQFDYDTITDVILHLRYTAREGGAAAARGGDRGTCRHDDRRGARRSGPCGCSRCATSSRPSGPGSSADGRTARTRSRPLTLTLREEHYPFWARQVEGFELHAVELFASVATRRGRL